MPVAGMILGWILLGQASDAVLPPLSEPPRKEPAVLQSLAASDAARAMPPASIDASQNPRRPPELVDEAIRLPADSALTGRPLTLLEALGSTIERRRQLEIVRAYWRLVEAAAEYRFSLDHVRQLEPANIGGEDASLRSDRAEAAARRQEANLQAVRAQFNLAALARMSTDSPLPLPTDPPHVGAYRTYFNELFAGRTPPETARLAEKILPLQRRAIDDQAAAVLAAEDALLAVADDRRGGRVNAAAVASCSRELFHRRQAFIRLVCDYNRAIADYGLTVVGPTASARELVAMLIGPTRQAALPRSSDNRGSVNPTSANEPIATPRGVPTLAPPREGWRANEPTLALPREGFQPAGKNEPTLAPPRVQPRYGTPNPPEARLVPVDPQAESSLPPERIANKPSHPFSLLPLREGQDEGASPAAATPLYSALRAATPAVRAKQLTVAIHWDRYLPKDAGKPIGLEECLLRDGGGDRLATIRAYWLLRRRAAQYQILAEQAEFYEALMPVVLQHRNEPTGAADMLRLNAAQLAARAELGRVRVALVEAQFALALRIGATDEAAWPLASTVPHSGEYLLKLDAQPQSLSDTWPMRRLAATIPGQCENVRQHAAAVVEAETARVAAAEKYRSGSAAVDRVLETVAAQTEQTAAFLDSLADYNRSIAEYALTVLPPSTPADKLVSALVIEP